MANHCSILAWRIPWTVCVPESQTQLSGFHYHYLHIKPILKLVVWEALLICIWWSTVHGFTEIQTQLIDWSHMHTYMRETPTAWLSIDYYYIFNHIHGSYLIVNKISYFCRCEIKISISHSICVISYWVIIMFLIEGIIFNCCWSEVQNVWIQELSAIFEDRKYFSIFCIWIYENMIVLISLEIK